MIVKIVTADERAELQELCAASIPDIEPNAIPSASADYLYAPLMLGFRRPDGALIGGLLTCRTQALAAASRTPGLLPPNVATGHNELDLIAVHPDHRGSGIGSALIKRAEKNLRARGIRFWFGNVTEDLDADQLRTFYRTHNFTICDDGDPLPQALGWNRWILPSTEPPLFYFYKHIKR